MSKNLEDLKSRRYRDGNYEIAFRYCLIKVLEDFERRLGKLEREKEGLRPKIRLIESPKLIECGHGIKPKIKRLKPKPRSKVIYNYKISRTDPD